ncbi:uncharacterized protein LOC131951595 [Physella acuta]|uniref:uncharacterized protein LOC131951595 n=1 Tax=Physella acuta TaxID=109671 RepID=UPI0027DD294D|nr:uncharacterized protein LOC131951595 [Physella acuta]XP_059169899.1 uncharacterized protein LOC131951595 [Physella acuta]XP_059169900.1 uncharacterized protein LOC131951595 [Physella acuta]
MDRRGSGLAEQFMSNWQSEVFRDRCVNQIDTARIEANPQVTSHDPLEQFLAKNSSKELENFIFSQSKTREEYVSLVAEMLMALRDSAKKPVYNSSILSAASPQVLAAAGIDKDDLLSRTQDENKDDILHTTKDKEN